MPRGAGPAAPMLHLSGITLEHARRTILDLADLSLPLQGVSALIGPNGAGKTSLLKLIQGLHDPSSGQLTWTSARPPRRAILLQSPVLLRRTAAENIGYVLDRRRIPKDGRTALTDRYLAAARLQDRADQPARRLSGGQQRRLAFAQALAQEPDVLLLDEPTAGLDPAAAAVVERMIVDVAAKNRPVLFSAHDIAQVRRLADRIVFLHGGQCAETGDLPDVFEEPKTKALAAFLTGDLTW